MKTKDIMGLMTLAPPALIAEHAAGACGEVPDISAALAQIRAEKAGEAAPALPRQTHAAKRDFSAGRLLAFSGVAAGLLLVCGMVWVIASVQNGLREDVPSVGETSSGTESSQTEADTDDGTIPAEFEQAMLDFIAAQEHELQLHPEYSLRSDWCMDIAPAEYDAMLQSALKYYPVCARLAVTENDYSLLAQYMVSDVLCPSVGLMGTPGKALMNLRAFYSAGNEQVALLGAEITAADVAELQTDFGYLIAPALRDLGRLDLLQIAEDAPCRDAALLAEFTDCFKPYSGSLPAELEQAFTQYENGQAEFDGAVQTGMRYFMACARCAQTDFPHRETAQRVVITILQAHVPYDSGSAFDSAMRTQYANAANAVNLCGADLSAEDAAELQAKYGFLIAPALRDLRRLELLQLPADAPCTDAEQLAKFADYYRAEDYFVVVLPKETPIADANAETAAQIPEAFTGVIPAEFCNAAARFQQTGTAEDFAKLTDYAAEHPALIAELSTTLNDYTGLTQQIVHTMLGGDVYPDENPAVFRDNMQQMYTEATLALQALGQNNLSAVQVQELQQTYGCMIAPALRTYWHSLEMLQLPADAPCTDAEKLADLAACFAP